MPQLGLVAFWGLTWGQVIAIAVSIATAAENARKQRSMRRAALRQYNEALEDRLVMTSTADGPRGRVYGRTRNCDGVLFKGTHGTHSEYYTLFVSLAGHEVDEIETVYFGDQPLELESDGVTVAGGAGVGYWVKTAPFGRNDLVSATAPLVVMGGSGSVLLPFAPYEGVVVASLNSSEGTIFEPAVLVGNTVTLSGVTDGTWTISYQHVVFSSKARIWKFKGAPGQDVSKLLKPRFPSMIKDSDKGQGIAGLGIELLYDQDAFPTGVPQISAVLRAAKVLDTRTGLVAWTQNPAMIARDWALYQYGGGAVSGDLIEPMFTAAANACDVLTVFQTTSAPEIRPLYQCGIVCKMGGDRPDDYFDDIVQSMAGKWGWSTGQVAMVAGVWRPPVFALDETWLSGRKPVLVVKDAPRPEAFNTVRSTISDAAGYTNTFGPGTFGSATAISYTPTPTPEVSSETYIAADGEKLTRDLQLAGVTRVVHAQHIAGVQLRDSRDGMIVQLSCNMKAFAVQLFDVGTVSLPVPAMAGKAFEVIEWKFNLEDGIELVLKETGASIYSVYSGLKVLDAQPNTSLPLPWVVEQMTGLSVESGTTTLEDGWPVTRVQASWDPVVGEAVRQSGQIELQYVVLAPSGVVDSDWSSVFEQGNATSTVMAGLKAGVAYLFRVRAINTLGVRGPWSSQMGHVVALPPLIDAPNLEPGSIYSSATFISTAGARQFGSPSDVDTLTFTSTYDCKATVTITFDSMGLNANSTADNGYMSMCWLRSSAATATGSRTTQNTTLTSKTVFGEFDVQAGVTYEAVLRHGGQFPNPSGAGIDYRVVRITVEVFNR
jgi:hypothetical protein